MKKLNVLSLFDGMSCGQQALLRAGFEIENYYAAEIDKHAIAATQHNFPKTIQLGDVTKVFAKDLPKIDIILAGSPCQGFSFAGKQLAFDDPRSKLFFEFVRLLKECNPEYWLLENVVMKKEYEHVITEYVGVEPIVINSALMSAQNRVRLYWTNIYNEPTGLWESMTCMIPQPKDKGILLRDILESDIAEKYYLSEKYIEYLKLRSEKFAQPNIRDLEGKASCIMPGNEGKQGNDSNFIVASRGRGEGAALTPKRTEYGKQIRKDYESGKIQEQRKNIQQLEPRTDGKTNCLTSVQKDNYVVFAEGYEQDNRAYFDEGKSGSLDTKAFRQKVLLPEMKIRRLTPVECCRLQTVDDNYFKKKDGSNVISETQQYRCLGNGWTVDVIAYILSFINK